MRNYSSDGPNSDFLRAWEEAVHAWHAQIPNLEQAIFSEKTMG